MNISNEVKVGALAVAAILIFIFGYNYLDGTNILSQTKDVYVEYDNIAYLDKSAGVFAQGYQVGIVSDIQFKPDGSGLLVVTLRLNPEVQVPKTSIARIVTTDPLSGPAIQLQYTGGCTGDDCLQNGDFIPGKVAGLIESLLGDGQLEGYIDQARDAITMALDSIARKVGLSGGEGDDLSQMKDDFSTIVENFKGITTSLDYLLKTTSKDISGTLGNLNSMTSTLSNNNDKIADILSNTAEFTGKLTSTDLDSALQQTNKALTGLTQTLVGADATLANLDKILYELNYGEGSAALMINDPQLYNNLNNSLRDLDYLLKDFRLNPKRYVNVSVFGKKSKPYESVNDDPEGLQVGQNPKEAEGDGQ
ncbi:MAG: MlaD family protein [Bacteroidota bacterium]